MISSARSRIDGGTARPSALATLRLTDRLIVPRHLDWATRTVIALENGDRLVHFGQSAAKGLSSNRARAVSVNWHVKKGRPHENAT
jgi:hypothetical protein